VDAQCDKLATVIGRHFITLRVHHCVEHDGRVTQCVARVCLRQLTLANQGQPNAPVNVKFCVEGHTIGSLSYGKLPADCEGVGVGAPQIPSFGQVCGFWPRSGDTMKIDMKEKNIGGRRAKFLLVGEECGYESPKIHNFGYVYLPCRFYSDSPLLSNIHID